MSENIGSIKCMEPVMGETKTAWVHVSTFCGPGKEPSKDRIMVQLSVGDYPYRSVFLTKEQRDLLIELLQNCY